MLRYIFFIVIFSFLVGIATKYILLLLKKLKTKEEKAFKQFKKELKPNE